MQNSLLARIERHLRSMRISATAFGRAALRDPKLVHQLRCGRRPRAETARRIAAYLDGLEPRGGAA